MKTTQSILALARESSFAIASLLADGNMTILDKDCVDISFPSFYQDLNRLAGNTLHF